MFQIVSSFESKLKKYIFFESKREISESESRHKMVWSKNIGESVICTVKPWTFEAKPILYADSGAFYSILLPSSSSTLKIWLASVAFSVKWMQLSNLRVAWMCNIISRSKWKKTVRARYERFVRILMAVIYLYSVHRSILCGVVCYKFHISK